MKDFRKLEIWKDGIKLAESIYKLTEDLPSQEKYNLISQMRRSATSIPSNIAEGCRGSNKELVQFLNITLGSSFELETQLILTKKIYTLDQNRVNTIIASLNTLQKRINAYRTFIKNKT